MKHLPIGRTGRCFKKPRTGRKENNNMKHYNRMDPAAIFERLYNRTPEEEAKYAPYDRQDLDMDTLRELSHKYHEADVYDIVCGAMELDWIDEMLHEFYDEIYRSDDPQFEQMKMIWECVSDHAPFGIIPHAVDLYLEDSRRELDRMYAEREDLA